VETSEFEWQLVPALVSRSTLGKRAHTTSIPTRGCYLLSTSSRVEVTRDQPDGILLSRQDPVRNLYAHFGQSQLIVGQTPKWLTMDGFRGMGSRRRDQEVANSVPNTQPSSLTNVCSVAWLLGPSSGSGAMRCAHRDRFRIPASQPHSLTFTSSLVCLVGTSLGKHRDVLRTPRMVPRLDHDTRIGTSWIALLPYPSRFHSARSGWVRPTRSVARARRTSFSDFSTRVINSHHCQL
jgi:hypothetical protein